MSWTDEDREALIAFTNAAAQVDCDDIKVKEQIKKVLLNNRFIVHVLNNDELEENDAEPDEYFGVNILPWYMVPSTQTSTKNFLCYEINYKELDRYNSSVKILQIVFHILCHQLDIIDEDTGIARHDLLAALIQDQFNYTNYFGAKIQLVSDVASTTDYEYAARTLTFEQITDNNLVKTRSGNPKLSNKDIVAFGKDQG